MATIAEIRRQYPQYSDLTDEQLADALHSRFYRDIPKSDFYSRVGIETSPLRDIGGALAQGVGQVVELPGQIAGLITGDFDNAFTRTGQRISEAGEEFQSPAFRARQQEAAERVREAEREDGFFGGLGQQARELVTDPLSFAAGVAQMAPAMVGTGGVGAIGRAAAGRLAAREGAEQAAIQAARRRGAAVGAGAGAGAMVGGDAGATVYERIMATPEETLQRSDVYRGFLAEGMSPEDARQATALRQARLAAAPAAAVSALTAGLGGAEAALLTGALRGGAARGTVRGALQEGAQEAVEEGSQGISENLAVGEIDPTVQPLDDVGGRVGAGIVLGGASGAGAGFAGGLQSANIEPAPTTVDTEPQSEIPAEPTEPGTAVSPPSDGVPDTGVPDTGAVAPPSSEGVPLLIDGTPRTAVVTPEPDGNVLVEWDDGRTETVPQADWDAVVQQYGAPVDIPVQENLPEAEPVSQPDIPVQEITQQDFDTANTPTREFEAAVKGKTLPAVADYLAENAQLEPIRNIMGRAAGVLRAFEKAGVKTEFGVSGQRPANTASRVIGERAANTRGVGGLFIDGSGTPTAFASVGGMRRSYPGVQEITTSHEIIHAVTLTSIRGKSTLPKNSRVRAAVDGLESLHKEVQAFYRKAEPAAREGATAYRVSNPDELIAYGLTDYNFQQFLKTVPTKTGNAFTDFVNYIARILGVPNGEMNALTRLIELSEDLIPTAAVEQEIVAQNAMNAAQSGALMGGAVAEDSTIDDDYLREAERIPSLSRKLQRATRLYENGRMTPEDFTSFVIGWKKDIDAAKEERAIRRAFAPRTRGPDYFRQRILEAKRRGDIEPEMADFAEWAVAWNPDIFNDVGISIRQQPAALSGAAGMYNPTERLVTLFSGMAFENTAVHEILHHAERMMPHTAQEAIRSSWRKAIERAKKTANAEQRNFLALIEQFHRDGDGKAIEAASNLITSGRVPYDFYQYVNPSEFWAVNATDIMRGRYDVRGSTLGRLKQWLKEMAERAKAIFGMSDRAEIIKALNSLSESDGTFQSKRMLQRDGGIAMNIVPTRSVRALLGRDTGSDADVIVVPEETRRGAAERKWLDRFQRMRQVESLGQLADASKSFYEAARRMNSVAAERIEKFRRDYFDPIKKLASDAGLTLNDLEKYLYAMAVPDHNARIQRKQEDALIRSMETEADKKYQDGDAAFDAEVNAAIAEAYKSGNITTRASGITTEEAQAFVAELMAGPKADTYRRISELYRAAVRARMEYVISKGRIEKNVGMRLLKEEPNYVPMKSWSASDRWADANLDTALDEFGSMSDYVGQGFSTGAREWFNAKGRSSIPYAPFSTFISDTAAAVVRAEKDSVGQLLMQFMEQNPIAGWKIYSETNLPRDSRGRPYTPGPRDEDFLITKRGGKTFYLRIGDPLMVRAARELSKAEMRPFLDKLRWITAPTRLLGRSFTTLQPSFFTVNYVRDIQAALLNVMAEQDGGRLDGKRIARSFAKEATSRDNFRALIDFEFGRENPRSSPELRNLIEQWKLDGGTVSWVDRKTPQEVANQMRAEFAAINDATGGNFRQLFRKGARGFRATVDALENANAVFEGMTRFAAYKAALDAGATRQQAAMLAREITVDFQRAGETAQFMNNFWLFMNANIQGTARTLKSLKSPQVRAILGGAVSVAATLAMYNAAVSGEDDDGELLWDKIPDYEKDRNLIIMAPDGGGVGAKIPMPYGFGFFTGLGTRLTDTLRRGDDVSRFLNLTLSSALNNFSPLQFAGDNLPSNIAAAAVPTLLKPVPDLWRNENFMSKPIYNEPFDSSQSMASASRFNTPEAYKWWAQTLNDISGGEGKIPGKIDTPAEAWQYLAEFAMGGVGNSAASLFADTAKLTGAVEGREELGARDIPIARRFITSPAPGRNVGEYYENANKAAIVQRQFKETEDKQDFRRRHPVDTHPRVVAALSRSRTEIRQINKQRKAVDNSNMSPEDKAARKAELKARIDAAYVRFNRVYNEVEKDSRR